MIEYSKINCGSQPIVCDCGFQCDSPHQWIAQLQVGPVSVYRDRAGCHALCLYTVTGWGVMSCVHIL